MANPVRFARISYLLGRPKHTEHRAPSLSEHTASANSHAGAKTVSQSASTGGAISNMLPFDAISNRLVRRRHAMNKQVRRTLFAAGMMTAAITGSAWGQEEKLGALSFATSCDPKVQAEFERGVA